MVLGHACRCQDSPERHPTTFLNRHSPKQLSKAEAKASEMKQLSSEAPEWFWPLSGLITGRLFHFEVLQKAMCQKAVFSLQSSGTSVWSVQPAWIWRYNPT